MSKSDLPSSFSFGRLHYFFKLLFGPDKSDCPCSLKNIHRSELNQVSPGFLQILLQYELHPLALGDVDVNP